VAVRVGDGDVDGGYGGRDLDPGAAAMLVEFGADSPAGLDAAEAKATALAARANLVHPVEFTRDEDQLALFWKVREGLADSRDRDR
jgi:D-lactate dehydrogenase